MRILRPFDDAEPGEIEDFGFDFVKDLPISRTIVSAEWSIAVVSGPDSDPDSRLSGDPYVVGTVCGQTLEMPASLSEPVTYLLQATATDDNDRVHKLHAHLTCRPPA